MEPPRERFERSISEQEERMKELLDNATSFHTIKYIFDSSYVV